MDKLRPHPQFYASGVNSSKQSPHLARPADSPPKIEPPVLQTITRRPPILGAPRS